MSSPHAIAQACPADNIESVISLQNARDQDYRIMSFIIKCTNDTPPLQAQRRRLCLGLTLEGCLDTGILLGDPLRSLSYPGVVEWPAQRSLGSSTNTTLSVDPHV
jgi:hypothetical protein